MRFPFPSPQTLPPFLTYFTVFHRVNCHCLFTDAIFQHHVLFLSTLSFPCVSHGSLLDPVLITVWLRINFAFYTFSLGQVIQSQSFSTLIPKLLVLSYMTFLHCCFKVFSLLLFQALTYINIIYPPTIFLYFFSRQSKP